MNSCNAVSKVLTSIFNMLLPDFTITFHLKTSSLPHSLFLGVYTLLHEIMYTIQCLNKICIHKSYNINNEYIYIRVQ